MHAGTSCSWHATPTTLLVARHTRMLLILVVALYAGLGASNIGFGQAAPMPMLQQVHAAAPMTMPQQVHGASFQNQYWADGLLGDHYSPPPQV